MEVKAEKGQDVLEQIISMDEGCHYLGECALVPKESPIHQSGLLFYNTLFDENAACHLALGYGFDECVKGFENMTEEELLRGISDSLGFEWHGADEFDVWAFEQIVSRVEVGDDGIKVFRQAA